MVNEYALALSARRSPETGCVSITKFQLVALIVFVIMAFLQVYWHLGKHELSNYDGACLLLCFQ